MQLWLKTKSISENAQEKTCLMEVDRNGTSGVSEGALQMGQIIVLSKQLNAFWNLGISRMLK